MNRALPMALRLKKTKPRLEQEPRSAYGRAVNKPCTNFNESQKSVYVHDIVFFRIRWQVKTYTMQSLNKNKKKSAYLHDMGFNP